MAKKTAPEPTPEAAPEAEDLVTHDPYAVEAELVSILERWDVDAPLHLARAVELLLTSPGADDKLADLRRARWHLDQHIQRLEAAE